MEANKREHLTYIKDKGRFVLDCNHQFFSENEVEILEKFGHWFDALAQGILKPFTELQERFVLVSKFEVPPFSPEEETWVKYLGRERVEKQYGDSLNKQYALKDCTFLNRDMQRQQNKINFSVISSNHRD